jgi:hypothetical protein
MYCILRPHVEDIKKLKIKTLIWEMCMSLVYIVQLYYNARCRKHKIPRVRCSVRRLCSDEEQKVTVRINPSSLIA